MKTIAIVILLGACAILPTGAFAQLSRVALTTDDVVALYSVPVDKKPARKIEWKFGAPRYVRFVVEESDAKRKDWRICGYYPYSLPVTKAVVMFLIDQTNAPTSEGDLWPVTIRIGGELGSRNGWVGCNFSIPAATPPSTVEEVLDDPDKIFLQEFKNTAIRFRLESSEKPYAN